MRPVLTPENVNNGVKVGVGLGAGYLIYKAIVAVATWECFGCGVLVTP